MQSYGMYTDEQQAKLKARNQSVIGKTRHYDEIVSHGVKKHAVNGFMSDRGFDEAFRPEYFQTIQGHMWGLDDVDVVSLALKFRKKAGDNSDLAAMRTDFPVGSCPPGYHLPQWIRSENDQFDPIVPDNGSGTAQ